MNPFVPSIWWIGLSVLTLIPLLVWGGRLSARQRRIVYLCRWLLLPYLGLVTGTLSPRLMGLTTLEWVAGLQNGVGVILAVLILLLLVRATLAPTVVTEVEDGTLLETSLPAFQPAQWAAQIRLLLMGGAEQFYWCFLRAAVQEAVLLRTTPGGLAAGMTGGGDPVSVYGAIWFATLLAAPEAILRVESAHRRFFQLVALIATTVLFFFTGNFWLCAMLHAAILLLG